MASQKSSLSEEALLRAHETLKFLKKCYEVGNRPLWAKPDPRQRALAKKAKVRKQKQEEKSTKRQGVLLCGEITAQNGNKYAINDQFFEVTADTWTIGIIEVGATAEVHGRVKPNTEIIAKKITILKRGE